MYMHCDTPSLLYTRPRLSYVKATQPGHFSSMQPAYLNVWSKCFNEDSKQWRYMQVSCFQHLQAWLQERAQRAGFPRQTGDATRKALGGEFVQDLPAWGWLDIVLNVVQTVIVVAMHCRATDVWAMYTIAYSRCSSIMVVIGTCMYTIAYIQDSYNVYPHNKEHVLCTCT